LRDYSSILVFRPSKERVSCYCTVYRQKTRSVEDMYTKGMDEGHQQKRQGSRTIKLGLFLAVDCEPNLVHRPIRSYPLYNSRNGVDGWWVIAIKQTQRDTRVRATSRRCKASSQGVVGQWCEHSPRVVRQRKKDEV